MLRAPQTGYDQNNQPKVNMQFNNEGAAAFDQITKKMAETAQITGETQRLAIVLDGEVSRRPVSKTRSPTEMPRSPASSRWTRPRTLRWCSIPGAFPWSWCRSARTASAPRSARRRSTRPSRRRHRPAARHGLHDRLLPAARRGGQCRPDHLRRAVHRHPQRHRGDDDPARHRRYDPHPGDGGRRQRAHLRPHEGRGGRRQDHRRRHQRRLQEGLPGGVRLQHDHDHHRHHPVLGRIGRHQGVRPHARHRGRALDVHGGPGDPVDAQPAQRVEALPQPKTLGLHVAGSEGSLEDLPLHALQMVVPGHARCRHRFRVHHRLRRRARLRHRLQGRHAHGGGVDTGRLRGPGPLAREQIWASRTP